MSTAVATGAADAPYWEALREGRLVIQRCQGCDRWRWPAVARCGDCGTWEPRWVEIPMTGELFSWTKSWHAFGGSEGLSLPYVSVLVALPQAGDRRLLGLYEGDEALLDLGLKLKGRVAETNFAGQQIPSIRWSPA